MVLHSDQLSAASVVEAGASVLALAVLFALPGDPKKILKLLPEPHAGCCLLPLSSEDVVSFFLFGFVLLRTMI